MVLVARAVQPTRTSSSPWNYPIIVLIISLIFFFTSSVSIIVSSPIFLSVSLLLWPNLHYWVAIWLIVVLSYILSISSFFSYFSVSVLYYCVFICVIVCTCSLTHAFSLFVPTYHFISCFFLSPVWSLLLLLLLSTSPWGFYKLLGGGVSYSYIDHSIPRLRRLLLRNLVIGPKPPSLPANLWSASTAFTFRPGSARGHPLI